MAIYKRGRIWWIDFYDQSKRRIFESSHSTNRRDAERLLASRVTDAERGLYQAPCKITIEEFADKYMTYAKANKSSWDRDAGMCKHIRKFFGNRKLTEISLMDLEGYKSFRSSLVEKSTVNRELALLKHLFNLAISWDLFQGTNPLVTMPRKSILGLQTVTEQV